MLILLFGVHIFFVAFSFCIGFITFQDSCFTRKKLSDGGICGTRSHKSKRVLCTLGSEQINADRKPKDGISKENTVESNYLRLLNQNDKLLEPQKDSPEKSQAKPIQEMKTIMPIAADQLVILQQDIDQFEKQLNIVRGLKESQHTLQLGLSGLRAEKRQLEKNIRASDLRIAKLEAAEELYKQLRTENSLLQQQKEKLTSDVLTQYESSPDANDFDELQAFEEEFRPLEQKFTENESMQSFLKAQVNDLANQQMLDTERGVGRIEKSLQVREEQTKINYASPALIELETLLLNLKRNWNTLATCELSDALVGDMQNKLTEAMTLVEITKEAEVDTLEVLEEFTAASMKENESLQKMMDRNSLQFDEELNLWLGRISDMDKHTDFLKKQLKEMEFRKVSYGQTLSIQLDEAKQTIERLELKIRELQGRSGSSLTDNDVQQQFSSIKRKLAELESAGVRRYDSIKSLQEKLLQQRNAEELVVYEKERTLQSLQKANAKLLSEQESLQKLMDKNRKRYQRILEQLEAEELERRDKMDRFDMLEAQVAFLQQENAGWAAQSAQQQTQLKALRDGLAMMESSVFYEKNDKFMAIAELESTKEKYEKEIADLKEQINSYGENLPKCNEASSDQSLDAVYPDESICDKGAWLESLQGPRESV